MTNVNQTASDNAEEFGFHAGDLVQEWLWDDYVDDKIRPKIEEITEQAAAKTAVMNPATPLTVSGDWNGIRLRAFGKGR